MTAHAEPLFADLLAEAVREPGRVSDAYRAFHRYSLGNQIAAAVQCAARGIPLGPIATFPTWRDKGRSVRKGEKALALCMPITSKRTETDPTTGEETTRTWARFVWKSRWFVLSQTDGDDYTPEPPAAWDAERALAALEITRGDFASTDGNAQGYCYERTVCVSPLAVLPHKTLMHELAHVVLGHTAEGMMTDGERTPRSLREAEAEGVAYILTCVLDMPGREEARGYIQGWLDGDEIPERSAQKVYTAANAILTAGKIAD